MRHDDHRLSLGFLTVQQTDELSDIGIRVLDPCSTLISASVRIGAGTLIYPSVVPRLHRTGWQSYRPSMLSR
jgi:hypothetical protein